MNKTFFDIDEPIAAQATPKGNGRYGVIRVSGVGSLREVKQFVRDGYLGQNTESSFIADALFALHDWNVELPVTIWFWPAGGGYTGQESLEIYLPGSQPLIEKVLQTLFSTGTIRSAGPGEFTFRAFFNGRLDLIRAEAVLGVIDADSDRMLESALRQLSGNLSVPLLQLRESLIEALSHLEAGFDFTDEDISFITPKEIMICVKSAESLIKEKLVQISDRTDYHRIPRIILTGPPNSGKSSLFNRLVLRNRGEHEPEPAIVSDVAGTTRDYLEREVTLITQKVLLIDTAGLKNKERPVSDIADTERGNFELKIGDLTTQVLDSADLIFQCYDARLFLQRNAFLPPVRQNAFILLTKTDVLNEHEFNMIPVRKDVFRISAQTGIGIEPLCRASEDSLFYDPARSEIVQMTALRCREAFQISLGALHEAETLIVGNADETLIACELRRALDAIGGILGTVQADDILDSIFSRFCIGK